LHPDQPYPQGVSDGPRLNPDTQAPPIELQVTAATNWADLTKEYAFFQPAFLYLTTPLRVDPFVAYIQETSKELKAGYLRSERPLFHSLMHPNGDLVYNFTLFLMSWADWTPFKEWLGTCAWNDPHKGLLRRLRFQDIKVRDEPAMIAHPVKETIDTVPVVGWCVETNRGSFYFKDPQPDDNLARPVGFFDKDLVYSDTVAFADALKKDSPNPYTPSEESK
jgi:hypothetical protein